MSGERQRTAIAVTTQTAGDTDKKAPATVVTETDARDRRVVAVIADGATDREKEAISAWARQLLAIRTIDASAIEKAKQAIKATTASTVVWSVVKIMARELGRHGWSNRSWAARAGLGGAAIGVTLFGGQGAGIAAFGTAIGVPLWIVLGSGAAFAGVLVEEFSRKKP